MAERDTLRAFLFPGSNEAQVEGLDPTNIRALAALEKTTSESLRYGAYLRCFIDDTRAPDAMTTTARDDGIRAMARLISLGRTELTGEENDLERQRLAKTTDVLTQIVTVNTYAPLGAQFMSESTPDTTYDPSARAAQQLLEESIERGKVFATEFRNFVNDTDHDDQIAHFKRIRGVNALAQAISLYGDEIIPEGDPETKDKLKRLQQTQELFQDLYIANYVPKPD